MWGMKDTRHNLVHHYVKYSSSAFWRAVVILDDKQMQSLLVEVSVRSVILICLQAAGSLSCLTIFWCHTSKHELNNCVSQMFLFWDMWIYDFLEKYSYA